MQICFAHSESRLAPSFLVVHLHHFFACLWTFIFVCDCCAHCHPDVDSVCDTDPGKCLMPRLGWVGGIVLQEALKLNLTLLSSSRPTSTSGITFQLYVPFHRSLLQRLLWWLPWPSTLSFPRPALSSNDYLNRNEENIDRLPETTHPQCKRLVTTIILFNSPVQRNSDAVPEPQHHVDLVTGAGRQRTRQGHLHAFHALHIDGFNWKEGSDKRTVNICAHGSVDWPTHTVSA